MRKVQRNYFVINGPMLQILRAGVPGVTSVCTCDASVGNENKSCARLYLGGKRKGDSIGNCWPVAGQTGAEVQFVALQLPLACRFPFQSSQQTSYPIVIL
jgi:hypothetical protein